MTPRLTVSAPAKVNLFLHVTGRRADGYHTLESLFALVDLVDTITLTRRDDGVVLRRGSVPGVDAEHDLAIRAARALQAAARVAAGVSIELVKRIPLGAGLGGGSSDAASVLLALNRLWGLDWPRARLAEVAMPLGADVPFFVGGRPALARGIGEVLTAVTLPTRWVLLVQPNAHVASGSVFAADELTRDSPSTKIDVFSEAYGRNDLAAVTCARHPAVRAALATLRTVSPDARMTGSGACVFATFESHDGAQRARAAVAAALSSGEVTHVARTLDRHPLLGFAR